MQSMVGCASGAGYSAPEGGFGERFVRSVVQPFASLDSLLRCCTRDSAADGRSGEIQVLSCEKETHMPPGQQFRSMPLTKQDSFDITFTPRKPGATMANAASSVTPRQRDLKDRLELPFLQHYPAPPGTTALDCEDKKQQKLLEMYQEFVLELNTGTYLTQLTSSRDYSDIHCQLMEDLTTLKLDQSNGRIIEFPLTSVSKVYRIVKNDDKWYSAATAMAVPSLQPSTLEHIVVVEFMRRKLAFVFNEMQASQRFLLCMELLIRHAQQKKAGKTLTPSLSARSAGAAGAAKAPAAAAAVESNQEEEKKPTVAGL